MQPIGSATLRAMRPALSSLCRVRGPPCHAAAADTRSARRRPQGAGRAARRTAHRQRRRHHPRRDAAADHREPSAFDPASTKLRLVIVGGLDGDARGAQAVIDAVRWMKRGAPKTMRDRWIVVGAADGGSRRPRPRAGRSRFRRPRVSTRIPNSRRAATSGAGSLYQAPDLVVEFRGDAAGGDAPDSLTAALRDRPPRRLGARPRRTARVAPRTTTGAVLAAPCRPRRRCTRRSRSAIARQPLDDRPAARRRAIRPRRRSATSRRSRGSRRCELSALYRRPGAAREGAGAGAAVALRREVAASAIAFS